MSCLYGDLGQGEGAEPLPPWTDYIGALALMLFFGFWWIGWFK